MREELRYILNNVNEWLKFAEAKHAGLIVFNSGILIYLLESNTRTPLDIVPPLLSVLLSFFAINPVIYIKPSHKFKKPKNVFFAGDLAESSPELILRKLEKKYNNHQRDGIDNQLAEQIVRNSIIATRKYRLFKISILVTIISILMQGIRIFFTKT